MTIPAPTWTPSNDEYHATQGRWSSSRVGTFRESPWEAYQRYVKKTLEPDPPSTAMELGLAVSQALTDPADIGQHCYCVGVKGRNSKAFRQAKEAYPGRVVLTEPEYEAVEGMVAAVHNLNTPAARVARTLLLDAPGYYEYCHRWEDQIGGVPCMIKCDRLIELKGFGPVNVELKTSRSPDPDKFARACWNFHYHAQAAFYSRGIEDLLGTYPETYYVVIHNEWPYEVVVYRASNEFLRAGDQQIAEDLQRLSLALSSGDESAWRQPWETNEVIPQLLPPPWVRLHD